MSMGSLPISVSTGFLYMIPNTGHNVMPDWFWNFDPQLSSVLVSLLCWDPPATASAVCHLFLLHGMEAHIVHLKVLFFTYAMVYVCHLKEYGTLD